MAPRLRSAMALIAIVGLLTGCGAASATPAPSPSASRVAASRGSALPTVEPSASVAVAPALAPTMLPPTTASLTLRPQEPAMGATAFADAAHGWLGGAGVILGTTDGGRTWRREWVGNGSVVELEALDIRHAWALAGPLAPDLSLASEAILRTDDGGATWTMTRLARQIGALDFVTPAAGWAIALDPGAPMTSGANTGAGRLLRTTDGGRAWTDAAVGTVGAVCFADPSDGWATGASALRTSDGGRHWTAVSKDPSGGHAVDLALRCQGGALWLFQDRDGGAGQHVDYAAFRSTDGGVHWRQVLGNAFYPGTPSGISQAADEPGPFAAPDAMTAMELGVSPAAESSSVTVTDDGGRSWRTMTLVGLGSDAVALAFPDGGHVFVLGGDGSGRSVLLATDDGGRTWSERWPTVAPAPMAAIAFVSPTVGFGTAIPGDARAVLRTIDGGATWTRIAELPEPVQTGMGDPALLSFADPTHGWVVTSAGHLLATDDGGLTWRVLALPVGAARAGEASLADPLHGCIWAAATDGSSGVESSTADAGATWHTAVGVPASVAACARGAAGAMVANAAALVSPDAGAYLSFLGDRTAWFVLADGLDRTTDGGATWQRVTWPSPAPDGTPAFVGAFEVSFATASDGWMLAADGAILRTTDGGRSWTQLS